MTYNIWYYLIENLHKCIDEFRYRQFILSIKKKNKKKNMNEWKKKNMNKLKNEIKK